jgi:hypothetical protein
VSSRESVSSSGFCVPPCLYIALAYLCAPRTVATVTVVDTVPCAMPVPAETEKRSDCVARYGVEA